MTTTITSDRIEQERARLAARLAEMRADRRERGEGSLYSDRDLMDAINAAAADDDEIRNALAIRDQGNEWRRLADELRRLRPDDRTVYGDIGSLRTAVARAKAGS